MFTWPAGSSWKAALVLGPLQQGGHHCRQLPGCLTVGLGTLVCEVVGELLCRIVLLQLPAELLANQSSVFCKMLKVPLSLGNLESLSVIGSVS